MINDLSKSNSKLLLQRFIHLSSLNSLWGATPKGSASDHQTQKRLSSRQHPKQQSVKPPRVSLTRPNINAFHITRLIRLETIDFLRVPFDMFGAIAELGPFETRGWRVRGCETGALCRRTTSPLLHTDFSWLCADGKLLLRRVVHLG